MSDAPKDVLAYEAANRARAAIGALLGAALPLGALLALGVVAQKIPVEEGGELLFIHAHATPFVVYTVIATVGAVVFVIPLMYLYRATAARRPEIPAAARICAIAGPIGYGISKLALQLVLNQQGATFAGYREQTYFQAKHLLSAGGLVIAQSIGLAASLTLGFAFVLICLNAMRAGLLTRFMGVLGMLVGALFVIPIGSSLPVVQSFWLIALALVFLGRWPGGTPPAWSSGKAQPWPSQQELRERREQALAKAPKQGANGGEPDPADGSATEDATPARTSPQPKTSKQRTSTKKKRKRKR